MHSFLFSRTARQWNVRSLWILYQCSILGNSISIAMHLFTIVRCARKIYFVKLCRGIMYLLHSLNWTSRFTMNSRDEKEKKTVSPEDCIAGWCSTGSCITFSWKYSTTTRVYVRYLHAPLSLTFSNWAFSSKDPPVIYFTLGTFERKCMYILALHCTLCWWMKFLVSYLLLSLTLIPLSNAMSFAITALSLGWFALRWMIGLALSFSMSWVYISGLHLYVLHWSWLGFYLAEASLSP